MEDLLDLYAEPYDPRRPVVCFDETSTQALVKERNAAQATIQWRFNTQDARTKLHRLYPSDFTVD